jgi:hypothetical protein
METQTVKKKIPGWAKFLIVIAILGVVGLTIIGIGLRLVAGWLTSKGGQYLTEEGIKEGIEKVVETGMKQSGMAEQPKVDITEKGLVLRDEKTGQKIAFEADQKLPDGFPSDIPVFQPSQAQGSMIMGPMTMVTIEASAPAPQVAAFYQAQLPGQGWTSVFAAPAEAQSMMAIYRKENRQVTVNVTGEGDAKSSLTLTYGGLDQPPPAAP